MHLRPLTRADLPRCIDIGTAAFLTDPLFQYIWPQLTHSTSNFMGYRRWFMRGLHKDLNKPSSHCWVCVSDDRDDLNDMQKRTSGTMKNDQIEATEVILGVATWTRYGSSPTARFWGKSNNSISAAVERKLFDIEGQYAHLTGTTGAFGNFLSDWEAIGPELDSMFRKIEDYWHLNLIAVAPEQQRRGVGKQLLQWGTKLAALEAVPATLFSSSKGAALYRSCGYKVINWIQYYAEVGVPEEGRVFIYDEKGDATVEVSEAEARAHISGRPIEVKWKE